MPLIKGGSIEVSNSERTAFHCRVVPVRAGWMRRRRWWWGIELAAAGAGSRDLG